MSTNNRNHSFSLQPKSSEIVNMIKDQKKSAFVSDAICEKHQRSQSKQELSEITSSGEIADDEAENVLQVRGWRRVLHRICSFHL